ncbi:MAG: transcription elongation factor GreA [bacterium]|nr:transcription elongation factor GreA [bacterium]
MVPKKEFYLTTEGIKKLKTELDDLVNNKRKEVARALKEAKEFGDLSENASWDEAKDRQMFIESRIAEIEDILKNAKIIHKSKSDKIGVGSVVHVELEEGTQKFHIVGSAEASPEKGKISNESPIGKALIGRAVGEEIEVEVPAGNITYKILKVE